MENKQLTTNESLELISRMIENTRRNFSDKGGTMFLIWGYTTIAVTAAVYALFVATSNPAMMWIWWSLPLVGGLLTWRHYSRFKKPVKTHLDKAVNYVWGVFGAASIACALFAFIASVVYGKPLINILFTIALMVGMATAITGLTIKYKPVAVGGFIGIGLSFIILCTGGLWQFPLFAAIFLAAQVIPGHMLNRAYRKGGGRNV